MDNYFNYYYYFIGLARNISKDKKMAIELLAIEEILENMKLDVNVNNSDLTIQNFIRKQDVKEVLTNMKLLIVLFKDSLVVSILNSNLR